MMTLRVPSKRKQFGTPAGLHREIDTENASGVPRRDGMALTDAQIKGLKPIAGSRYSKADGGGLLLDVTEGGVKSWV